jgi:hypothetical protein
VLKELLAIPFGHGGESDMVKLGVLTRTLTSSTDPVETVALLVLEAQVLRHEDGRVRALPSMGLTIPSFFLLADLALALSGCLVPPLLPLPPPPPLPLGLVLALAGVFPVGSGFLAEATAASSSLIRFFS